MSFFDDEQVRLNVDRLPIEFDDYGFDRFGLSKKTLVRAYSPMAYFYRHYLKVTAFGMGNVPPKGRALIVSNHSGGIGADAAMILTSLILNDEAPRLGQGMADFFLTRSPFTSLALTRLGHLTGLPEHGEQLLEDERLVVVFPEGARGAGKLYKDRYKLVRFGTGFVRLALKMRTPIIPCAFIGGEEAFPQLFHIDWLAKLVNGPFVPVAPQLVLFPLPVACQVYYGPPMHFEGDGSESDQVIDMYVDRVRESMERLISAGLDARPQSFMFEKMRDPKKDGER
ncbi:MAG: lysophospholipid acyltransferase family protein [Polyangiales bacterium]